MSTFKKPSRHTASSVGLILFGLVGCNICSAASDWPGAVLCGAVTVGTLCGLPGSIQLDRAIRAIIQHDKCRSPETRELVLRETSWLNKKQT